MTKLFAISVMAVLIIFHPEIRQGLARLGQRHLFGTALKDEEIDLMFQEIIKALETLAQNKHGAMIAIEKKDPLNGYIASGVAIDARVSSELLQAIFTPNNPLHDGSVVVQQARVTSAGCIFPLTQKQDLNRIFGMRHRAALGLSEETDALIFIVSEERQDIALVYRNKIYKDLMNEELLAKAKEFLLKERTDE